MPDELMARTERRRVERSAKLGTDRAHRGQFFTPDGVSRLIVSMVTLPIDGELRVLDPGAGVGSLTAALASRCASEAVDVKLSVDAVESDETLGDDLSTTLRDCSEWHPGSYRPIICDFIDWAAEQLQSDTKYDIIIMNPPYRKITKGSPEELSFKRAGVSTTNLYSGFVTLALRLLGERGQIVAITPRSFANGAYFKAFRKELFHTAALRRIHVFDKRNAIFKDAEVLQENVIFMAQKSREPDMVRISSSSGDSSEQIVEHLVDFRSIVRPDDPQQFVHIATDLAGLDVAATMASQPLTLPELGLEVSTGRVVDFRSREHLRKEFAPGDAPLVYPGHLTPAGSRWPNGAPRKWAALAQNNQTKWTLLPAGNYVVVKRLTSKEERRRVVATLVRPSDLPGEWWAFENHLNVFHCGGRGIADEMSARRLAEYLNGDVVDSYIRLFNGHTQINAGDLRSLRYPNLDDRAALPQNRGV